LDYNFHCKLLGNTEDLSLNSDWRANFLTFRTLVHKQASFRESFHLLVQKQSATSNSKIQPFTMLSHIYKSKPFPVSLWTAWDDLLTIQLEAASLLALYAISVACW